MGIVLGFLEIILGLFPLWGGVDFSGDLTTALNMLFLVFVFGVGTLVAGFFYMKRRKWARKFSLAMLAVVLILMLFVSIDCLRHPGGPNEIFCPYAWLALVPLLVPIVLLYLPAVKKVGDKAG